MAESTLPPSPAAAGEGARPSVMGGLLRPLRRRDFGLLVVGQTTSTFGDFLFIVAFPFLLLSSRAGVGGLGLALTLLGVARLVGTPLGGVLADRWHPRVTMVGADLTRAAVLGWLAWTLATGSASLSGFCVVAGLLGLLEGAFLPAYRAITPALVPSEELIAANSTGEALNVAAAIVAQLVAGIALTAFGASTVVDIDVATFAVSALTLLAIRSTRSAATARVGPGAPPAGAPTDGSAADAPPPTVVPPPLPPAATTLRSFARRSQLFTIVLLMTGMVSVTAAGLFAVGLPVLAEREFSAAAEAYGVLLVGLAVGRLGGSIAAGGFVGARHRGYLTLILLVVHGAVLVALPGVHALGLVLPALAILGFADGTLLVIVVTVLQQLAPKEIVGRVMATITFTQTGSFPISAALAGFAIAHWGITRSFLAGGLGVLAVAALGFSRQVVRNA